MGIEGGADVGQRPLPPGEGRVAERMLGYTAAEAIGQPVTMLIPEHGKRLQGARVSR